MKNLVKDADEAVCSRRGFHIAKLQGVNFMMNGVIYPTKGVIYPTKHEIFTKQDGDLCDCNRFEFT